MNKWNQVEVAVWPILLKFKFFYLCISHPRNKNDFWQESKKYSAALIIFQTMKHRVHQTKPNQKENAMHCFLFSCSPRYYLGLVWKMLCYVMDGGGG